MGKKGKFNRFSEESKHTVQKLRNIELYELGEISKTIQCQACSKYSPDGSLCCPCGVCHMPSPEQKRKIRTQFEIMSVPYYIVRVDDSRGARHGESQWQCDHRQAKDAKRRARKKGNDSLVQRWRTDDEYRISQTVRAWTEEYCRYLDYLTYIC